MTSARSPQLIAAGNFLFRYRNAIFPVIGLTALVLSPPRFAFGDRTIDAYLDLLGVVLAIAGQGLRALTIGYEYIIRGGRQGKVYAERLVQGGVFAHCRNPLYLGNLLIVIGIAVMVHSPLFYLIGVPFFVFAYAAIIAAEENFLRAKFGAEYEDYCRRVNRIWPNWKGLRTSLEGMRFNWRRLVIREYGTPFALALWFIGIHAYKLIENLGAAAWPDVRRLLWWLGPIAVVYVFARFLKKSGRLTEYPAAGVQASAAPQGSSGSSR
jgi:protein-S-isoprenylcysteine O-methyltransferase Ste14